MGRKRVFAILALGLAIVAAAASLALTSCAGPAGDRPTLVYFRADL